MGRPAILAIRIVGNARDAQKTIQATQKSLGRLATVAKTTAKAFAAASIGKALAAALAPVAGAAASAGAALGAFGVAAAGQVKNVQAAAETATKLADAQKKAADTKATADRLAASGSAMAGKAATSAASAALAAAQAQDAYNRATLGMPAATKQTVTALGQLKSAYADWSDAMAPTVMPAFTLALQGLKAALPALTPLVKAAAAAITPFIKQFKDAAESGAIEKITKQLAGFGGKNLSNIIASVVNLAKGLGSLFLSLQPAGLSFTKMLADMTAKFAAWAKQTQNNPGQGIGQFAALAKQTVPVLQQLVLAVIRVTTAFSPFAGVTLTLALALAQLINATPIGMLQALVPVMIILVAAWRALSVVLLAARIAMLAMAVATAIQTAAAGGNTTATTVMSIAQRAAALASTQFAVAMRVLRAVTLVGTAAQWAWNAAVNANPVTLIVVAIVALVAILVVLIIKNKAVREAFVTAWHAIWSALKTAYEAVKTFLSWVARIAVTGAMTEFRGWMIIIKTAVNAVVTAVKAVVSWIGKIAVPAGLSALKAVFNGIKDAINGVISAVKTLISWLKKITGGLLGKLVSAVTGKSATRSTSAAYRSAMLGRAAAPRASSGSFLANIITPVAVTVVLDGAPLTKLVKRTVVGAMQYDGSRLASGGWA